ncbi:MAG: hypothetical protein ACI9DC_004239 [Gammaproteobacteria bacterium]|jgi:hypothetical protein
MAMKEELYDLKNTPKDFLTRTGDEYPDDHDAFVESVEGKQLAVDASAVAIPDWRTAKSLKKLKNQIEAARPGREKSKDGTIRDANHCPNPKHAGDSDHCVNIFDGGAGSVTALDGLCHIYERDDR